MYDHSLTLDMVLALMNVNDCNKDFQSPMRKIKRGLKAKQLKICHKEYKEAHKIIHLDSTHLVLDIGIDDMNVDVRGS